MKRDILELIKKSGSVRKFTKKSIKQNIIKIIVEGGFWGPSLFGIQPWRFVVIRKRPIINKIASIVYMSSKKKPIAFAKLLEIAARIIMDSKVLIAIYINHRIKNGAAKYGVICMKKGWMAELLSAGASIQNMFLLSSSLGLGAVWLDAPTIFSHQINKSLNEKNELIAFLALGYPDQKIKRSYRSYKQIVKFI